MGKNKIIAQITLIIMLALTVSVPMASAQYITNCANLNDAEKTKGIIITVLEESIGSEGNQLGDSETEILQCLRITTTETIGGKETKVSKYGDIGSCPSDAICQRVQIIASESGLGLLFSYLGLIYRWSARVIGIVSVAYITWGGIQISVSGGDSSAIEEGKRKIMQSLAGLALLFMSAIILYTINPNFFTL